MRQPTTRILYAYWNELRAGRLAPHRLEIEPARIGVILADTFMLQRMASDDYGYRLAGTRLCERFGSELRGQNFLDGWSSQDRAALQRCLCAICERGAAVALTLETGDQRQRLELEAILLPLLHADSISRILGAISGDTAHWLVPEPIDRRRLLSAEVIWPDGRAYADLKANLATVRDRLEGQSGSARGGAKPRPPLRVLEGGRSARKPE